jgi:hypothetical protein
VSDLCRNEFFSEWLHGPRQIRGEPTRPDCSVHIPKLGLFASGRQRDWAADVPLSSCVMRKMHSLVEGDGRFQ